MSQPPPDGPGLPGALRLGDRRYDSFLVRVLSHAMEDGFVNGQVTHVASHSSVRFTDVDQLIAFIRRHVGGAASQRPKDSRAHHL